MQQCEEKIYDNQDLSSVSKHFIDKTIKGYWKHYWKWIRNKLLQAMIYLFYTQERGRNAARIDVRETTSRHARMQLMTRIVYKSMDSHVTTEILS